MSKFIVILLDKCINTNNASVNRKISLYKNITDKFEVEFHIMYAKENKTEFIDGISYVYHKSKKNRFISLMKIYFLLKKYPKKESIFVEYPWGLFYLTPLLVLLSNKRFKFVVQDSEHPLININYFSIKGLMQLFTHYFFKKVIIQRIYCNIIMTKKLCRLYEKYNAKNIIHIPMTFDSSRFLIEKEKTREKYFAYCGSMNCAKDGVDILVKSFSKIASEFDDIYLYLIGPKTGNKCDEIIFDLIKSSKFLDRIKLLGSKNGEEIPQLLKNAYALCLARPDSLQAQYGFPTKLGEYLATGNPVIVTDVGEIPNYLQDGINAFIAKNNDVDSFAEKMKKTLTNDNVKKISYNGKNIAMNVFNSEVQGKKLSEFIRGIYDC